MALRDVEEQDTVGVPPDTEPLTIDHRATLNDALDTMLSSSHGGALVTGRRDEYQGVVDFQSVIEHIAETEKQAAHARSVEQAES